MLLQIGEIFYHSIHWKKGLAFRIWNEPDIKNPHCFQTEKQWGFQSAHYLLCVALWCAEWGDGAWSMTSARLGNASELVLITLYVLVEGTEQALCNLRNYSVFWA